MREQAPVLRGSRIALRPVEEADLERLMRILREPGIARYWTEPDDDFDRRELLAGDGAGERVTTFVITLGDETIGWIAGWERLHRDYRHAGIDLFVSGAHQGRGYGTEAIRLVCRFLFDARGHHRVTVDPAADNICAIRAYEKAGFRRVGIMRCYERGADGSYHDGMLLDLLAEDLRDDS
jgi:aminoglycoside 6'-N-acetyltransferase